MAKALMDATKAIDETAEIEIKLRNHLIEGLEKKEYNMEDIELIFRKLSEYRSAMRRARDARRVYTEANILEELDS